MFNFIDMMGNYDSRMVDRHEEEDLLVSTCRVTDGQKPFETAVAHPEYNDGSMVVVEMYDTEGEAQIGHLNWVKTMTADDLPKELVDCCNAGVGQLAEAVGCDVVFPRKEQTK